jgi:hypothetical protein
MLIVVISPLYFPKTREADLGAEDMGAVYHDNPIQVADLELIWEIDPSQYVFQPTVPKTNLSNLFPPINLPISSSLLHSPGLHIKNLIPPSPGRIIIYDLPRSSSLLIPQFDYAPWCIHTSKNIPPLIRTPL